jgi:hypothetical protein
MAKQQQAPKARERAGGDDRDVSDIETEIDEALENADEDEVDARLDKAIEKADKADGDEVLIELEGDEDAEDEENEGSEDDEGDEDGEADEKPGGGRR